jgi:hypothetical protein
VSARVGPIDSDTTKLLNSPWHARRVRALAGDARFLWITTAGALCFAVNLFFSRYFFWDSNLDLTGGRFVAQHWVPRHEALTTAAKRGWIDQQWLAHLTYYEAWRVGGYPLVAAVSSLLVASAFALLCSLLVARSVPPQRAFLWTLAAFVVCFGNTVIRAQSFAYPLFVLLLWAILADERRPGRRFLFVVPILVLWSNLHGTVLLGTMLLVGYSTVRLFLAVRRRLYSLAAVYSTTVLAAVTAVFANPYGFSIINYYRALIGDRVVSQYVLEWAHPSLGNVVSIGFFVLLVVTIGTVGYGVGRGFGPSPTLLAMVAFLALLATQGVRYQAWFALAGVLLCAEILAAVRPAPPELAVPIRRVASIVVLAFVVVAVGVLSSTKQATFERLAPLDAMSAAASFTAAHPRATILADEQASSALLWLYPNTAGHVAFDARLEQYSDARLRDWFTYINGAAPGWPSLAAKYDVLVASRKENPNLVAKLEKLRGWRVIASNEDGIALVRGPSRSV